MPGKLRHKPGEPLIRTIDYTVDDNGCWVWKWSVHKKGYASVWVDGRGVKAHRVAYEQANGPISAGTVIRHICPNGGNPSCVNPAHLRAGSPKENAQDMVKAGNQGNQKLLPSDAAEIRRIFAEDNGKTSQRSIARQYGVSPQTIGYIIANKNFYDPEYKPPPRKKRKSANNLGEDKARQIRQLYLSGGISQKEVADRFGIIPSTVSNIVRNKLYPDPDPNYVVPPRKARNQKLTKAQADEIREKIQQGAILAALAKEYGVNQATISNIKAGKVHAGILRQYPVKEYAESQPIPTLKSVNGPALTSKAKQVERQRGRRNTDIKPKRRPGEPFITDNDWVLDPETGCHNWKWGNNRYRPYIALGNRSLQPAYRVNWELHNGPITKGRQINHRCNNHRCVNPEHLYVGDQFDNVRDNVYAGSHAAQKLTWKQVREIRDKYEPGKNTHKKLAREYGVTDTAIGHILNNKTYRDPNYIPKSSGVSVRRRLTAVEAATVRHRYRTEQVSKSDLALDFGVSINVIAGIIRNKTYQDDAYTPPTQDFIRSRWGAVAGKKISQARRAVSSCQAPFL